MAIENEKLMNLEDAQVLYNDLRNRHEDLADEVEEKQEAPSAAGTAGQVLGLDSNLNPVWVNNGGGGGGGGAVDDVQIDGTSIVNQGTANIPKASSSALGVVKVDGNNGITLLNDALATNPAADSEVKAGSNGAKPVVPDKQHAAAFYGLAKAAGDSTQAASSNAVGNYTENAKSAISQMIDAPETVSGTTPSITAKAGVRYICGECSTLTIIAPESGCIDVTFQSGSTPTVLTVTSAKANTTIKWANGFDPASLDADTVYEVNILDGEYGVVGSWT